MKNQSIENKKNQLLNQMFDAHYQVSILTAFPGNTNRNEILSQKENVALQIKHQAAHMAMNTLLAGRPLYRDETRVGLSEMVRNFSDDAKKTVQILDKCFSILMDELVQLN